MIRKSFNNRFATRAAVVMAALGLVGAGTATGAALITGKQIKNRSVAGIDVKRKTLGVTHLTTAARASLRGARGPAGAQGATGTKGDTGAAGAAGAQGARGPSDVFFTKLPNSVNAPNALEAMDTLDVPAGKYAITAQIHGLSIGGGDHSLQCELRNGATVIGDARDFYVGSTGRANMTIVATADLNGAAADSNDVVLYCNDDNSGVLVQASMTATQVAALTAA